MNAPKALHITSLYSWETFRADVRSGVMMLPIAVTGGMALGVASGMGALTGLYCVVIVGFFAAVFGGTKAQVSGPSTALAVIVSVVLATGGASLAEIGIIAAMAGLFQILFGLLRIGRFVAYMPYVVLSGFVSGIGVTLLLSQVQTVLGTNMPAQGAVETIKALPAIIFQANADNATIALVAMAILLFWPQSLDKWLPAPVTAVIAGTALGASWLDEAVIIGTFPSGLPVPSLALPSPDFLLTALVPALLIALIGSIFTLMMSLMADAVTGVQHNPNRELIGQGIGNVAAGVLGAMPGTGNAATLINLQFGGRTVVAGIARAACLLALLMGLGSYAEPIPLAALSAILIRAGWDLIDWRFLVRLRQMQRGHAAVMLLTLGLTALIDPLTAVGFGLVTAGIAHAARLERLELDSVISVPLLDQGFLTAGVDEDDAHRYDARVGLLAFRGQYTVASSGKLVTMLGADIRGHDVVIIDFSRTTYVDDSAAHVIALLLDRAVKEKTRIIVLGLSEDSRSILNAFDVLRHVPPDQVVDELDEARRLATRLLAS